jgi:hypothetical protein
MVGYLLTRRFHMESLQLPTTTSPRPPEKEQYSYYPMELRRFEPPRQLVKAFRVEADDGTGAWKTVASEKANHQGLVRVPLGVKAKRIRLVPQETWGEPTARIFAVDAD